jgi:hypothetical protein
METIELKSMQQLNGHNRMLDTIKERPRKLEDRITEIIQIAHREKRAEEKKNRA